MATKTRNARRSEGSETLGLDSLAAEVMAEATAKTERIKKAAQLYGKGRQKRDQAARLVEEAAAEEDAALAALVTDLPPNKVAGLLEMPTRSVTEAVKRHKARTAGAAEPALPLGGGTEIAADPETTAAEDLAS